nr:MAG TPA: hypothetical protein [Caudoviricetes sp.]
MSQKAYIVVVYLVTSICIWHPPLCLGIRSTTST